MGKRKIENKRKISNYRVGKIRDPKIKIFIAVEGDNKTEKLYFSNFESRQNTYTITYAKGNYTDPLKLVQMLIKEIAKNKSELDDGYLAYCIFDTDIDVNKNLIIKEAKKLAKENNIIIISSSPCIELWFLLHYEYTTASLTNAEVIRRLKKYYPQYQKNKDIFPDIYHNVDTAIKNARKLEKYQMQNKKVIGTVEANPCTEIYKIVEYLIKE